MKKKTPKHPNNRTAERGKKSDNPKKRVKTKTASIRSTTEKALLKVRAEATTSTTTTLLDELKSEYIKIRRGYRNGLNQIVEKAVYEGSRLLTDDKRWAEFQAHEVWQGKPPKKRPDAVRLLLRFIFGASNGSLYWRAVQALLAQGVKSEFATAIKRGGGLRKLAAKKAARKKVETHDDDVHSRKIAVIKKTTASAAHDNDEDAKRSNTSIPLKAASGPKISSKAPHAFVVYFRFPPGSELDFPKAEGAKVYAEGYFDADKAEVIVESWSEL